MDASSPRHAGETVGNYRILDLLGEGGMGRVYLAEHVRLGRKVALKMLLPELSSSATVVKRFFDEARSVNEISHENIVEITDFYEGDGGEAYFIMELLKGRSLYQVLQDEVRLPIDRALPIAMQMCRALTAAHDRGIVHRDVKPDNVFLVERAGKKDFVKMLDFGIAKLGVTADGVSAQKTAAGTIMGTPEYMSPEQATGYPVDPRADVYSFGAVLYEVVTGKKLYEGKNYVEILHKHLTATPIRPGTLVALPPALEEVILQCLEKDPKERPKDLRQVELRLEEILRDPATPVFVSRPPAPTLTPDLVPAIGRPPPAAKKSRFLAVTAGVLVVGAAAGVFVLKDRLARPAPPTTPAQVAPAAAEVEIAFDSTPPGAEVFAGGKALGLTPFSKQLAREDQKETFTFTLEGYLSTEQVIPLSESTRLAVVLAAEPPPAPVAAVPVPVALPPRAAPAAKPRPADKRKAAVAKGKTDKGVLKNGVVDDPFAE